MQKTYPNNIESIQSFTCKGRVYDISFYRDGNEDGDTYTCSCSDFVENHRGKQTYCKHIKRAIFLPGSSLISKLDL